MDVTVNWYVWLIAGLTLGVLSGFGSSMVLGILLGVGVLASPFVIFTVAGAQFMPFALFYGGLMISSSIFYRWRSAKHTKQLRDEIAEKRRRMGL